MQYYKRCGKSDLVSSCKLKQRLWRYFISSDDTVKHADGVWSRSAASTNDGSTSIKPFLNALDVQSILSDSVVSLHSGLVLLWRDPKADVSVGGDLHLFSNDASEMPHLVSDSPAIHAVDTDEGSILEVVDDVDQRSATAENADCFRRDAE